MCVYVSGGYERNSLDYLGVCIVVVGSRNYRADSCLLGHVNSENSLDLAYFNHLCLWGGLNSNASSNPIYLTRTFSLLFVSNCRRVFWHLLENWSHVEPHMSRFSMLSHIWNIGNVFLFILRLIHHHQYSILKRDYNLRNHNLSQSR